MSPWFALGLAVGAAVIVFGQETRLGRGLLIQLHLRVALLRRWYEGRR